MNEDARKTLAECVVRIAINWRIPEADVDGLVRLWGEAVEEHGFSAAEIKMACDRLLQREIYQPRLAQFITEGFNARDRLAPPKIGILYTDERGHELMSLVPVDSPEGIAELERRASLPKPSPEEIDRSRDKLNALLAKMGAV